jgi:hypothetical protein
MMTVLLGKQGHPRHKPKRLAKIYKNPVSRDCSAALWLVVPLRQTGHQTNDILWGNFLYHVDPHTVIVC